MNEQYRRIESGEIAEAAEYDPQRALLMILANSTLAEAEERATGKAYEPIFHKSGWRIAIETPQGIVGLWSCWLDNQFYLGYPKRTSFLVAELPDEVVIRIANKYRIENPDKFLFSVAEKEFDLNTSRDILGRRFKEDELKDLLQINRIEVPTFELQRQALDRLIMDTLGVEYAHAVVQVDGTAVGENYEGEYKDPDKPLEKNGVGQIVAYRTHGKRIWATFYGPRVVGDKGRVWIDHSDWNSNGTHFDVIDGNSRDGLRGVNYGHDGSMGISTYPFSMWSKYALDSPATEPEVIQPFRDKFLALACVVARQMGGANAVNIDYGFVLVPEQLEQVGYSNVTWLKGRLGTRQGWGNDIVLAEKMNDTGKEVIVLKSANSIVPWSNIRRVPCTSDLNADELVQLLTF